MRTVTTVFHHQHSFTVRDGHLCECKSLSFIAVQAVKLGTSDYLNTFKKKKREEVAGVSRESGPEEPPIIDELCKSLVSLLACSLHPLFTQLQCCCITCIASALRGPQACVALTDLHTSASKT